MMDELILKALADFIISIVLFWMLRQTLSENKAIRDEGRQDGLYLRQLLAEAQRQNQEHSVWMREMIANFTMGGAARMGR